MEYKFIQKDSKVETNCKEFNFRFLRGYRQKDDSFDIAPNSHGGLHNNKDLSRLDCFIRAINWGYGFEPLSYKDSVLVFKNIEEGNKFLENVFTLIKKHKKGHISSSVLGTQYHKHLPKGFIEIRVDKKFYHYIFDINSFEFKKYDFKPLFDKYKDDDINLYNYNFETKKIELNKKNKCWVQNL